ncbi:ABC transporter ATP-binding protein [Clostridiaceae bacterium OttesenSCG-928-D20]|nr:ABC transporter ATP-binding protein [Clostridiaceae bacterium OttesenSCG-928-D20]
MLKINNFSKSYPNGKKAVDNISLEVNGGDIYGFVGHNGAGKTTTIRAVVGVLDFDEGEIFVDGYSVKADPIECKKRLAYIPDDPALYEYLTGTQYLNFICDIFEVGKEERIEKIKYFADKLELADDLNSLVSSYSHGMKQKLAVISALVHDPKLLILDEPFVGLDPKAAFTLKEIFREMCSRGTAIFFSSHVLETVEKLCNKIAIIKDGKLVVSGKTEEVQGEKSLENLFLELLDNE